MRVTASLTSLQEYAALGWEGEHCEGGPHLALFTLLCWGLLYDLSPPDAFRSRFQDGPLDLRAGNGEFAAARRGPLEARLAEQRGQSARLWQRPSSPPCASSARAWRLWGGSAHAQGQRPRPLGPQPRPRALERAASKDSRRISPPLAFC